MDTRLARNKLTDLMAAFTGYVGKHLPTDVLDKLAELRAGETSPLAAAVYDSMFENLAAAARLDRPCCQDTGAIQFFVRAGARFPLLGDLAGILTDAVRRATIEAPLRHNAVETFVEKNTGDNTGSRAPWIEWEIAGSGDPGQDEAVIEVYMAGGGCSLPGQAKVLMPAAGYEGVAAFVFDVVASYGVNACPPLLVGVGVSTSVETAAMLSKRAILRPLGSRHPNPDAARMELLLENGLNRLGLGPQGITGNATVLGVHLESSARHPSTIGVGVSVGCWAHRRGTIRIGADLSHEVLSHKEASL
ncbi:MAG: L(+)-tartrate dehydratase subunit alpha [Desulfovibrionaceae bacterium]|nr:L(+)-tartrate dehydratase subunit alpha [Desulfovibrionaceae bacterium]MBF0513764.1 L(+)-tartrate dehydratase subunit alpha [Desulfovibrionaceae bacterium]